MGLYTRGSQKFPSRARLSPAGRVVPTPDLEYVLTFSMVNKESRVNEAAAKQSRGYS